MRTFQVKTIKSYTQAFLRDAQGKKKSTARCKDDDFISFGSTGLRHMY
jgi:hypothetical protein